MVSTLYSPVRLGSNWDIGLSQNGPIAVFRDVLGK